MYDQDPRPDAPQDHNPYQPPQSDLEGLPLSGDETALRPIPFEDLEALPGFWARIGAMFSLVFRNPSELIDRVPVTEGFGAPWRFNLLMTLPYLLFTCLIMGLMFSMTGIFAAQDPKLPKGFMAGVIGGEMAVLFLFMTVAMFVWGLVIHLSLWMWGGTRQGRGLEQTIRTLGYATGFLNLVMVVPIVGPLAAIAGWVFIAIGLARLHRTETWRGVCAVILTPFLCCCGLYAVILAIVIGVAKSH